VRLAAGGIIQRLWQPDRRAHHWRSGPARPTATPSG